VARLDQNESYVRAAWPDWLLFPGVALLRERVAAALRRGDDADVAAEKEARAEGIAVFVAEDMLLERVGEVDARLVADVEGVERIDDTR
jgi:hypothetical protein